MSQQEIIKVLVKRLRVSNGVISRNVQEYRLNSDWKDATKKERQVLQQNREALRLGESAA